MHKAFQKLIYLASPYSDKDANVVTKRVLEVQDATARLIEQGHLIFSPIVHSHPLSELLPEDKANSLEFWLEFDRAMIDKADELWILRLAGHTRSKGVHAELYHALDRGIPVKYINYPDLSVFADVGICTVASDGLPEEWPGSPLNGVDMREWGKAFPSGPKFQVGDLVRILIDSPNRAPLIAGSEVEVIDSDSWYDGTNLIRVDGNWVINAEYAEKIPEPKPTIIGLTGHAQSGKDTAGKYLVENHGFTRIGLADAVKDCLYALDPVIGEYMFAPLRLQQEVDRLGWDELKSRGPETRKLLQRMGTEVGREIIGQDTWIKIAERKIKELGPAARVVITDIRFPNEAEWVRALGGKVVRINREGFGPVNDHASDARLSDDLVDIEIENSYDIPFLHGMIEKRIVPYV